MHEILLRPKVSLGGLDGCVAKQQLDLFQFAAGSPAHFRGGAAKIVGGDTGDTGCGRVSLEQLPDDLLTQGRAPNLVAAVHRAEHLAIADANG